MALCCAGCDDLECEDCMCAMEVHSDVCPGHGCEVCLARVENSKRLRGQRVVGRWQSALAKLVHKEKSKAFLTDIHQCGFEVGVSMRQQLADFLAWYDDWAYSTPRNQEEQDIESNLYGTMHGYDNVYLREWNEALARPNAKWKPPVLHKFCHKCALYHGHVSWCN